MRFALVIIFTLVLSSVIGYLGFTYFEEGNSLWIATIAAIVIVPPFVFLTLIIEYKILKAGTALIRTSKSKKKVAIKGGIWMIPIVYKIKEIPLNRSEIKIVLEGEESCLTYDFKRCDVEVALYVKIAANEEDILKASHAFGDKIVSPETLEELVKPKVANVLRSIVAETDSPDLIKRRRIFVEKVQEECKNELELHFGITLEKLAVRRVYFHIEDWIGRCIEGIPVSGEDEYPVSSQPTICNYCGNEGSRVYFKSRCFGKGETLLVVEDVPVVFCSNCGEDYLSQETREEIERITRDRETVAPQRPVSVAVFK